MISVVPFYLLLLLFCFVVSVFLNKLSHASKKKKPEVEIYGFFGKSVMLDNFLVGQTCEDVIS